MTAKHPAPNVASGGTVRRRDVTTIEIKAAIAQARRASDQSISVESTRALRGAGSREKTGRSAAETSAAASGAEASGMATRIWGAPHCEQKGLPSSLL